jgi:predicted PurR-regulated permease PerM
MERTPWGRALIILGVIAVALYVLGELWRLLSHFADVMILFFLAWLLAFTLLPLVRIIQRRFRLSRAAAAGLVYLAILVAFVTILVLVIPVLVTQVSQLASQLPALAGRIPQLIRETQLALDERGIPVAIEQPTGQNPLGQEATQLGTMLVSNSVAIASGIASGLFSFTIVLIISFYLVLDGDRFVLQVFRAIPERYQDDAQLFLVSIDRSFGGFLRGTAIQAGIMCLGTAAIMSFAGLSYVLLASIFAGVVMVVPFIGPLLAMVVPLAIALFSSAPTSQLLVLLIALSVLQLIVLNVVAPKVMSQTIGIHPLLVFLALLVGIKEAGIAGAIFGVPIAAVIYATGRIVLQRWSVIERPRHLDPGLTEPLAEARRDEGERSATVQQTIRFERIGLHVGHAISRLFHVHSS